MIWKDVTINGITPKFVESIDPSDFPESITIHCVAYTDEISKAKEEIDQFREFAVNKTNQVDLMNGGQDLQIGSGELVDIVLDDEEFQGAVHYPDPDTDSIIRKGILKREGEDPTEVEEVIEWDIVIDLLFQNLPASTVYVPDFRMYPNIEYKQYNSSEVGGSTLKRPTTQSELSSGTNNTPWSDKENVEARDGNMAVAYRNVSSVGGSKWLQCGGFGFAIDNDMVVYRMMVRIYYANSSKKRGSAFKYPRLYIAVKSGTYSKQYYLNYQGGTNPSTLKYRTFDTVTKTLTLPSSSPSFYNSSTFAIWVLAYLDRYKTFWVDSVEVSLWYKPADAAVEPYNAEGKEIGDMTIVEDRLVKRVDVTGSACNLPAWLEVNGVRQYWNVSHDHNSGDTGKDGKQTLTFTISPPTDVIKLESSPHKPYQVSGNTAADNPGSAPDKVEVFYQ